MSTIVTRYGDMPENLAEGIIGEWPEHLWTPAAELAYLESGWNPWAVNDSALDLMRWGTKPAAVNGIPSSPELSCGLFQINVIVHAYEEWPTLFHPWVNAWAAVAIFRRQGWGAWYHSARALGLLSG